MASRQITRLRPSTLLVIIVVIIFFGFFYDLNSDGYSRRAPKKTSPGLHAGTSTRHPDFDNLLLDQRECEAVFPDLTKGIDAVTEIGPFKFEFRNSVAFQAKIENDQLYILKAPRKGDASSTMRHRQSASVQQIYRAIKTSPEPLPNVSFAFATHDKPLASSMSYARPVESPPKKHIFPMPHFSFWSWPLPFIKSLPAAHRAIDAVEAALPFAAKDPRAVWRGTTWFSNGAASNPRSRQDLVALARGTPWADVEPLDWETNSRVASNAIDVHDFCRYRYIIHTEGIGYSGRLQFHQLCESVLLSPPLEWIQHTTHLAKPIFSSTLLGTVDSSTHPSSRVRQRWPVEYSQDEANIVFTAPDWSDLHATVQWLQEHQDVAAGIARRQRQTYHDGGYLSPAAEVCYWRALLRGWAEVAQPVGEQWEATGVPFEEYISGGERDNQRDH